jgi:hypothetical protein
VKLRGVKVRAEDGREKSQLVNIPVGGATTDSAVNADFQHWDGAREGWLLVGHFLDVTMTPKARVFELEDTRTHQREFRRFESADEATYKSSTWIRKV